MNLKPSSTVRGILLDIEGTTTPIAFVHEVLFSYARAHLKSYLAKHAGSAELLSDVAMLREEHAADLKQKSTPTPPPLAAPEDIETIAEYVYWLMDRDRKSTGLKSLQGKIWKDGYLDGTLKAQVFADVPPALDRWHRQEFKIGIFSSGSVLAQKLLFAHTEAGDLARFIQHYFDTGVGSKDDIESYRHIAAGLGLDPEEVLFISDVVKELGAASAAEMKTLLCVRPGNRIQDGADRYQTIHSFDEIYVYREAVSET